MDISATVSIAMCCVCFAFVFILFLYNVINLDRHSDSDRLFVLLCGLAMIFLVVILPPFLWKNSSHTLYPNILSASIFGTYALVCTIQLVYTNYLGCYMGVSQKTRRNIKIASFEYIAGYIIVLLLNLKFGFMYKTDTASNSYSLGPAWWLVSIVVTAPAILDVFLAIDHRKNVHKAAWVGTFIFLFIPPIAYSLEFKFGFPFTGMAYTMSLYIVFFNIKSQQAFIMEKQRKELAESKISIMLSQIQPHFMYNSLTTIAALCEKDPVEAKKATMNFSRYLRKNIDSMNKRMPIPFTSELEHIQTYLDLEKLRFGDRLNVVMDIKTIDFLIPPLTIQPLVENAVKHGICNKVDGSGTLTLATCEKPNCFEITIMDDGVGFDPLKKNDDGKEHIGMENVRDRLSSMSDAKVRVESTIGEGTCITVTIPKNSGKNPKMITS